MFNITPMGLSGARPPKSAPAPKQTTQASRFGLTTISGEPQFAAAKTRPATPATTPYKAPGARLDFYA